MRGRKQNKNNNWWATSVPFFTAELGKWRSEDTLLRNCEKPWFWCKCIEPGLRPSRLAFSKFKKKKKRQNSILETRIKLHCNSSSQIKIHTFFFFYIKDLCSNQNVFLFLCATYGEKYNIICIFIYTQVVKKKERKSNLIAHCYIDCF